MAIALKKKLTNNTAVVHRGRTITINRPDLNSSSPFVTFQFVQLHFHQVNKLERQTKMVEVDIHWNVTIHWTKGAKHNTQIYLWKPYVWQTGDFSIEKNTMSSANKFELFSPDVRRTKHWRLSSARFGHSLSIRGKLIGQKGDETWSFSSERTVRSRDFSGVIQSPCCFTDFLLDHILRESSMN